VERILKVGGSDSHSAGEYDCGRKDRPPEKTALFSGHDGAFPLKKGCTKPFPPLHERVGDVSQQVGHRAETEEDYTSVVYDSNNKNEENVNKLVESIADALARIL
jgi:hypothetical protein